ncbi:MAG: hypothetical protein ABJ263_07710 [Tateyamaria sp.]|uniref:hypothetical protein n=1 Tax=Tateyamaria sp. TaxID=1929288 RepID=UPI00326CCEED
MTPKKLEYAVHYPMHLREDGYVHLTGNQYGMLECTLYYSAPNITSKTAVALQKGNIQIGLTVFARDASVVPFFVAQFDGGFFECPFALGAEPPENQNLITKALANVKHLGENISWPITLIAVDNKKNEEVALRVASLTPEFWQVASNVILSSRGVSLSEYSEILKGVYHLHRNPKDLFKKALHEELLGLREMY